MRARDRKKAKTTTPEDRLCPAQKDTSAPQYPFYPWNKDTDRLDYLARYTARFEEFKRLWSTHLGGAAGEVDFSLAWIWSKEPFNWLPESDLMRWLAVLLAKGDVDALRRFTKAYETYTECFVKESNKDAAKIHLMIACNLLWKEGRDRADAKMMEDVKHLARRLWAQSLCRHKKQDPTPANLKNARVPVVDWTLILREIGLSDLKPGKRGRKRIGNKTPP